MAAQPIRLGVFLVYEAQLLDTAAVDVLATMSKEYLSLIKGLPKPVVELAPSIEIMYICRSKSSQPEVPLTAGMKIVPTHGISDEAVQPGKLDILMIPGPDPSLEYDPKDPALAFVRDHAAVKSTSVLCICTGCYVCGAAGLFTSGVEVCAPRGLQGELKKKFPEASFVGDKYRWARTGNLWSSGGVTNGNELAAAFARENTSFPNPVAEIGLKIAEVGDRPRAYEDSTAAFTVGFVWQIAKAWLLRAFGSGRRSKKD